MSDPVAIFLAHKGIISFGNNYIEHHGVKGMHWGVRKTKVETSTSRSSKIVESGKNWSIDSTGQVSIKPGATISRVVRNHAGLFGGSGSNWHDGGPVYAAFKPHDISSYEHFFGRPKSLLVKHASVILKLTPTVPLKAPGPKEASRLYFDMIKKDPEAQAELKSLIHGMAKLGINRAIEDPSSKDAYNTYAMALDSGNYSKSHGSINQKYFRALTSKGYNMLIDPSDAKAEFDAPIIILNGEKTLTLKAQYVVDASSQHKARLAYTSDQAKSGKHYLSRFGYE